VDDVDGCISNLKLVDPIYNESGLLFLFSLVAVNFHQEVAKVTLKLICKKIKLITVVVKSFDFTEFVLCIKIFAQDFLLVKLEPEGILT
jgi:hypothetical protein